MCTPTPACRTTTPPALSGARRRGFRHATGRQTTNGTMQWAVSQAVPFRRMHVLGSMVLHQNGGWASGGWMSDSLVDGNVGAGPQQQWISRNSEWGSWTGANWNMVFVGVPHPPEGEWPKPPYTKIAADSGCAREAVSEVDARAATACGFPRWFTTPPESPGVSRLDAGQVDPAEPVLHCARWSGHCGDDQRAVGCGQESAADAGNLRAD
jgi:hypothetical protein